VVARKLKYVARNVLLCWSAQCAEKQRARYVHQRALAHSKRHGLIVRACLLWRAGAVVHARQLRLSARIARLTFERSAAKTLHVWHASVVWQARRKRVLLRCLTASVRVCLKRVWVTWRRGVGEAMRRSKMEHRALRRWVRSRSLHVLVVWVNRVAARRRYRAAVHKSVLGIQIRLLRSVFCIWELAQNVSGGGVPQMWQRQKNEALMETSLEMHSKNDNNVKDFDAARNRHRHCEVSGLEHFSILTPSSLHHARRETGGSGSSGGGRSYDEGAVEKARKEVEQALGLLEEEKRKRETLEQERVHEKVKWEDKEQTVALELEQLLHKLEMAREHENERERARERERDTDRGKILSLVQGRVEMQKALEAQCAMQEELTKESEQVGRARQELALEHELAVEALEVERNERLHDRKVLVGEAGRERALMWRMMDGMERRRAWRVRSRVLRMWRACFSRHVKACVMKLLLARRSLCQRFLCWVEAVVVEREREQVLEREREIAMALESQLAFHREREWASRKGKEEGGGVGARSLPPNSSTYEAARGGDLDLSCITSLDSVRGLGSTTTAQDAHTACADAMAGVRAAADAHACGLEKGWVQSALCLSRHSAAHHARLCLQRRQLGRDAQDADADALVPFSLSQIMSHALFFCSWRLSAQTQAAVIRGRIGSSGGVQRWHNR